MMPSAPTAHFSNPPPVNMLYMPSSPPAFLPGADSSHLLSAAPSNPGTGTRQAIRHIASTTMVKTIRDFSSGILKQLLRVLRMEVNIYGVTGQVFLPGWPV